MNQIRSRQITRLEKRALPYIKQREGMGQQLRNLHHGAAAHAAVLAFIMRYGNPQMGEPLSEACRRVAESKAWKACCEKFPARTVYPSRNNESYFQPYTRDRVLLLGDPLRHVLRPTLPGADEKDKFNRLFKSAPPWLIWFTFADYTAKLLDLNLPDLATVSVFGRSKDIFYGWWGLPESAFECHPWSDDTDRKLLVPTDLSLLGLGTRQDASITNRERKRALASSGKSSSHQIDWPHLSSEEWLKLDFKDAMSLLRKAGYLGEEESRHPEFCGVDAARRGPPRRY